MSNNKSNADHLHDAGVVNKAELSDEHLKAIDSLSKEEVAQLESIHKSANKGNDKPVGVIV
ncbi:MULTISPECIES: hypothetical protein [unclassified Colwellia]|jgi:diketogulonate reductase-like aldo/keto reductase|uniref:hypothetical protein n=1 Tax=unclassified Colwellia TaxID=196834 RepID=UPI0015F48B41|nr:MULTISPECIES: hypothetical protein [unclassified Colwellia]MBA6365036.1 hypothetical protein [Colwellia sp. BRX8-8]MBA6348223.1 hypothetical protein [Colwellia sp. BRX8-9]MBA6351407.1 hypothetical protein [Colwellia sp. BRX9-1]MBA6354639.1 hypothetical protein [Colwellia sp. BRX8-3]MBA6358948.1 hypothetical protein [Colwellia sp. BRX8-6]|tara:strand:- start:2132 stop:2314 length:183 start_codon:yes stop_codon:yes gene_type:complete